MGKFVIAVMMIGFSAWFFWGNDIKWVAGFDVPSPMEIHRQMEASADR